MPSLHTAMDDLDTRRSAANPQAPTEEALSRLSLVQALRDFEVANGRVIDLTERLLITAEELMAARQELEAIRAERDDLRARLETVSARHEALVDVHERTMARKSVRLGEAMWAAGRSIAAGRRPD